MKNIVLIGMMGCGKSTVGRLLSEALGLELIDTDAYIEAREGRAISDIFASDGEPYFRQKELELCRELGTREGAVIACGGGLPLQEGCMEALGRSALVFWLDRDPVETYDGLDVSGRPLAQAGRAAFLERYEQRAPIYRRRANHVIRGADIADPQAAAGRIISIWRERQ